MSDFCFFEHAQKIVHGCTFICAFKNFSLLIGLFYMQCLLIEAFWHMHHLAENLCNLKRF